MNQDQSEIKKLYHSYGRVLCHIAAEISKEHADMLVINTFRQAHTLKTPLIHQALVGLIRLLISIAKKEFGDDIMTKKQISGFKASSVIYQTLCGDCNKPNSRTDHSDTASRSLREEFNEVRISQNLS